VLSILTINSRNEPAKTFVVRAPKDKANDDYDSEDEDYTEKNIQELKSVAKPLPPSFIPKDGNFESFPELHATTIKRMKDKGYLNLFPIQQHCFYPIY
jgi:ATP-dependent RNA helicase DeaD